ncbi:MULTISPECIES: CDP-glycerol glycerophosphotransferase family protein [Methanobacterium]|uniref:CDP-glycerol glycerophosphotransferase family protein n=1 Tax=Methanobacterium veterum TaxID=408577 RepID=A0A9E5A595_9EURY|nr:MULTISPECIES: CDP-glycerol glycerophosphotransferase family protein [Methanobacterium]MCZ3367107.1 CDP-glycerol glycerophosphotransferase family protein [Methanobacterium veterum]MCZ3373745.1 CDP-glycerol glycerophosphotransferase family protein [Methanobacterium veterum]
MSFKISVITPAYNAEDYLAEALDSLVNQTFRNFEVIIVNDGSTDGTQEIIDEYCQKYSNFRSFTQPNSGVSKARNKGLDEACGDYIAFLDADDLFAPKALEKMYRTAFENDAELVIGQIREFDNFNSRLYNHPRILSKMEHIDKFDDNILWNFLLGNKLFLKEKIDELDLHFEDVNYSEDGIFVMNYIYNCSKITGCNDEVLLYRKRNFWETASITQSIEVKSINDYLSAHKMIYDAAEKSLIKNLNKAKTKNIKGEISEAKFLYYGHLDLILYKEVNILLDHFYRKFWRVSDDSIKLITDSILSFKDNMFHNSWERLKSSFGDLRVDELITDKMEMASNPLITIALNPENIDLNGMENLLSSIYAQDFPAFELLVNTSLKDVVSDNWLNNPNLKFLDSKDKKSFKNNSLTQANGNFILFVEDLVILDPRTLRHMFNAFNDTKINMAAFKISRLHNHEILDYHSQELAYSYRNTINTSRKSRFNHLDLYLSNKLLEVGFLRKVGFEFSNDSAQDVKRLYEKAKFKKVSKKYIFSTKDEKELTKFLKSHDKSLTIKTNSLNILKDIFDYGLKIRRLIKHGRPNNSKNQSNDKKFSIYIKILQKLPLRNRIFFYSIRGDNKLLENSSYVYNGLNSNKIFISKILPHSDKMQCRMLYYLITSKIIVTDDYLRYLRQVELKKEQKVIQLWHACGAFKKFGLDHPSTDRETEIKTHSQYTDVIVSSEHVRKYYASAFGLPVNKIRALGVPRTDMFFDEENKKTMLYDLYQQFPQLKDKKIILYSPTFREDNNSQLEYFDTKIDWEKLNASLNEDELFIINKHPLMKEDLLEGQKYSKIIDLSSISTYSLMVASYMMITDYSSVIFEYALLNKPMIFYCPDEYTRDFYLRYPEDLPGTMVHNSNELIKEIRSMITDPHIKNLKEFKMKYMGACDGNSTKKVVELIESYLSKNEMHDINPLNSVKKDNEALSPDTANMSLNNVELDNLSAKYYRK